MNYCNEYNFVSIIKSCYFVGVMFIFTLEKKTKMVSGYGAIVICVGNITGIRNGKK